MRVTLEISNLGEVEKLLDALKKFKVKDVKVTSGKHARAFITKGDKKINPTDLFGVWKKRPRTLDQIRKKAWKRNGIA